MQTSRLSSKFFEFSYQQLKSGSIVFAGGHAAHRGEDVDVDIERNKISRVITLHGVKTARVLAIPGGHAGAERSAGSRGTNSSTFTKVTTLLIIGSKRTRLGCGLRH